VLTLYSADDLLTGPGCPVCRYAAEASDRYLSWFALEGHADPAMISRLSSSLGTCAWHTRRLMGQPGATVRLTAVYRYVLAAARDRLADRGGPVRPCPACEHDIAAASRALETLLDGIRHISAMSRYRDLGGMCIPHLGETAASKERRVVPTLADIQRQALDSRSNAAEWLAAIDPDAEVRAVLRQAVPATGSTLPASCAVCLAAAQVERDGLVQRQVLDGHASGDVAGEPALCGKHLADAAVAAARTGRLRALLAVQAARVADGLAGRQPRRMARPQRGGGPARWPGCCPVCQSRASAEQATLANVRARLRGTAAQGWQILCVRHHLALRAADPKASAALSQAAIEAADLLIWQLTDDFGRMADARRGGAALAAEPDAWRQAAAYLDGGVFGGCPAH
jgi:hypothetical protein